MLEQSRIAFFISLQTMNILDKVLTYTGVTNGLSEGNPIVGWWMDMSTPLTGVIVAWLIGFVSIWLLCLKMKKNWFLWFLMVSYLIMTFANLHTLRGAGLL